MSSMLRIGLAEQVNAWAWFRQLVGTGAWAHRCSDLVHGRSRSTATQGRKDELDFGYSN
jgi:hypothetical protein